MTVFITHTRGAAAARALATLKTAGAQIPLSFVIGATASDATVDVFLFTKGDGFVAVMRRGADADVITSLEDNPNWIAAHVYADGSAPMRKLVGWLIDHWYNGLPVTKNARDLRYGRARKPTPETDELISELIWEQDPTEIAVALAQAFDRE